MGWKQAAAAAAAAAAADDDDNDEFPPELTTITWIMLCAVIWLKKKNVFDWSLKIINFE